MKPNDINTIMACRLDGLLKDAGFVDGEVRRVATVVDEGDKTTIQIEETMQFVRAAKSNSLGEQLKAWFESITERSQKRHREPVVADDEQWEVHSQTTSSVQPIVDEEIIESNPRFDTHASA